MARRQQVFLKGLGPHTLESLPLLGRVAGTPSYHFENTNSSSFLTASSSPHGGRGA